MKERQELTYRLQLRAALLLGTTLSERKEIRKAVHDLYNLRSRVVHGKRAGAQGHIARCAMRFSWS